jgi:inositol phosphorylceramide mannosyltransferase catalytic subunit
LNSKIPKIIWQTYGTRRLTLEAKIASQSWKDLNPDWDYRFCDDAAIGEFMEREFGGELAQVFHMFPLGVMKADVWRYAVLYKYGGVYSDIDTTCLRPVSRWQLEWETLLISLENQVHFGQWTIAAAPGHAAMKAVLKLILQRARAGIDTSYEHFVHKHTGPGVWTDAICEVLGLPNKCAAEIYDWHRLAGQQHGIQILPPFGFQGWLVRHDFGSANYGNGYKSWSKERELLRHPGSSTKMELAVKSKNGRQRDDRPSSAVDAERSLDKVKIRRTRNSEKKGRKEKNAAAVGRREAAAWKRWFETRTIGKARLSA